MNGKGRMVSMSMAAILASVPILLLREVGIRDFRTLSVFWYALLIPWMLGVRAVQHLLNYPLSYSLSFVGGFVSAVLCWFGLVEGVRVMAKQQTAGAWLRGVSWSTLFLVIYGFGMWWLYSFLHAQ
jgi:hypothetical protein